MAQHNHTGIGKSAPGILFAEDFDDDEAALTPLNAAIAPMAASPDAADLEQAREDGYAQGYAAAADATAQHLNQAATTAMGKLDTLAAELRETASAATETAIDAVTRLMFTTLATLLPTLCRAHDASEITGFVRDVIKPLKPDIAMRVLVAPSLVDKVQATACVGAAEFMHRISVQPDERMPLGDARLHWDGGTAMRNARQTQNIVADILQQFGLLDAMTTGAPQAAAPPERSQAAPPMIPAATPPETPPAAAAAAMTPAPARDFEKAEPHHG